MGLPKDSEILASAQIEPSPLHARAKVRVVRSWSLWRAGAFELARALHSSSSAMMHKAESPQQTVPAVTAGSLDPTDVHEASRAPYVAPNLAERGLMRDVLAQAIDESKRRSFNENFRPSDRRGARAWLRGEPGFTARECCQVLGIEYDAMMDELEREWKRLAPVRGVPE